MKNNFTCTLTGSRWWKEFLSFLFLLLMLALPLEFGVIKLTSPKDINIPITLSFLFANYSFLIILLSTFSIVFFRIIYSTVTIRNECFKFTGFISKYIKINLMGSFFCIITLGFYFPEYTKKRKHYIYSNSRFGDTKAIFLGKSHQLLKKYIFTLVLPLIIWSSFCFLLILSSYSAEKSLSSFTYVFLGLLIILFASFFFIIIPFAYLYYTWLLNLQWRQTHIRLKSKAWPSIFYMAKQTGLTLLTFGIYWPIMYINLYRYFSDKIVLQTENKDTGHFGFEGKTGKGFFLLWGQTVLSILTLGIYLPWAYANCIRYFLNNTFMQDNQQQIGL